MDIESKKNILRMFTYGLYLLTSKSNDRYCASTVTWVSQASFEPPLISVCLKNNTETYNIVRDKKSFLLHIIDEKQKNLAAEFFKPTLICNGKIFKV